MAQKTRPRFDDSGVALKHSGWTVDTLHEHHMSLRRADEMLNIERDRRYADVNIEREKALKIKETADAVALNLARELQSYKDDKIEASREKGIRDSGEYVTRSDLDTVVHRIEDSLAPIFKFVSEQKGGVVSAQVALSRIAVAVTASGVALGVIYWVVSRLSHA